MGFEGPSTLTPTEGGPAWRCGFAVRFINIIYLIRLSKTLKNTAEPWVRAGSLSRD